MKFKDDEQIKQLEESINLNWRFRCKTTCEDEHYYLGKLIGKKQKELDKLISEREKYSSVYHQL